MCGGGNEVEDEDQENKYGWYFIAYETEQQHES